MAGSDLGSFFPSPIHTPLSIPFGCAQVSGAVCGSPVLAIQWKELFDRGCVCAGESNWPGTVPGAGSECGIAGGQSSVQCPGLGSPVRLLRAGAVSGRLRSSAGPGAFAVPAWPAGCGSARASAGTGEQRGWKDRGRGKVWRCQGALKGYTFDVRELLRYLSWLV